MKEHVVFQDTISGDDFEKWANHIGCGLMKLVYKKELKSIYVNDYLLDLHNFDREKFVDHFIANATTWMHPEDAQKIQAYMARQRNMGENVQFECRLKKQDNSYFWSYISVYVTYQEDICIIYCTVFDVSSTKYTLSHLIKAKNDLDIIANNIPGGIVKIEAATYKIIYASDGFFRQSGLSRYEYLHKHQNICLHVVHPDDLPMVKDTFANSIRIGQDFSIEVRIVRENGEIRWSLVNGTPIRDNAYSSTVIVCVITDITESKRQLLSLEMWEKRALNITDVVGEILWEYDIATDTLSRYGKLASTYSDVPSLTGYLAFLKTNHIIHPDDERQFSAFFEKLSNGHKLLRLDVRFKNNLGIYSWVKLHGTTFCDESSRPVKIFGRTQNMEKHSSSSSGRSYTSGEEIDLSGTVDDILSDLPENTMHGMMLIAFDHYEANRDIYGPAFLHSMLKSIHFHLENAYPGILSGAVSPGKNFQNSMLVFFPSIASEDTLMEAAVRTEKFIAGNRRKEADDVLTVSIGLTASKEKDSSYDLLVKKAGLALCTAQSKGTGEWDIYGYSKNPDMKTEVSASKVPFTLCHKADYQLLHEISSLLRIDEGITTKLDEIINAIGDYFQASHAAFMEFFPETGLCRFTHSYCAPAYQPAAELLNDFPMAAVNNLPSLFDEKHMFLCRNLSALTEASPLIGESVRLTGIHSLISYALHDGKNISGLLLIGYGEENHSCSDEEAALFYLVGNLLNPYINNQRKHQIQLAANIYDDITGLMTFNHFIEKANTILRTETDHHFALVYADIRHFKTYNTNYGFSVGNKILTHFGDSLQQLLKDDEIAARILRDHFVLLLRYETERDLMSRLNLRTIDHNKKEKRREEDYFRFDTVYGVYLIQAGEQNVTYLLDKANLARKSIKNFSGSHYAVYKPYMSEKAAKEDLMASEMEDALKNQEFFPYFQPQFDSTGKPVSAEALARWVRSSGEILLPAQFLPVLESHNLTIELDFYMLKAVCRHLRHRQNSGRPLFPVSLNLTSAHLKTTDFVEHTLRILKHYQIPIEYLLFEIREQAFAKYPDSLQYLLSELNSYGIRVLLDNFGSSTGVSLDLLRNFDLYGIKMDVPCINNYLKNNKDRVIFTKIMEIAKEIGLKVFCEGIETSTQHDFFKSVEHDYVQGNYYSKPVPIDAFEKRFIP